MAAPASAERSDVFARTTTSPLPPGRRRRRCGSTVTCTPFGAIPLLPIETVSRRVETLVTWITCSDDDSGRAAPNETDDGSA